MKRDWAIAIAVGAALGFFGSRYFSSDRYTVQIMNQAYAIKTNTRTGETWIMNWRDKVWKPIPNENKNSALDKNDPLGIESNRNRKDIFDQLTATNAFSDLIPKSN
jgi:hypothetical protein